MPDVDLTKRSAQVGGSQPLGGFLVRPDGTGPWPGVVMVHEVFGVDDVMRRHAARLAKAGYLTLAVDLFSAGSKLPGGKLRCLVSTMRAMTRGEGRAFADIEAAR
jgi:carboxymethylenebutenolidase